MTGNQTTRTNQGGSQTRGGNYENPGGDSNGTMGTYPGYSELARFMNNGGGPEPHQGSNPGAQSDPGPKEIGFYDRKKNHVLGDDGVQAASERPSPMRTGGITAARDAGNGQTGARTAYAGGSGAMGPETRNPIGFAADMTSTPRSTQTTDRAGYSEVSGVRGKDSPAMRSGAPAREPGRSAHEDALGSGGDGYERQSRAAQKLVDMRKDSPTTYSRMDEPAEDSKPRVADKAGEVADAVKRKAGDFFAGARDKAEEFLNVDLNNDGSVGSRVDAGYASSHGGGSNATTYGRDAPGARTVIRADGERNAAGGYVKDVRRQVGDSGNDFETDMQDTQDMQGERQRSAGWRSATSKGNRGVKPEAFKTRETKQRELVDA